MQLSTQRLVLRPWDVSDAQALYDIAGDPEVGRIGGWKPHASVEESSKIISSSYSDPNTLAIISRSSNTPIGCIRLNTEPELIRKGPKDAEVSYWIGRRYWNNGYTTEAVEEIIRYAFEDLKLSKIWCQCAEDNVGSLHVQSKCGFRIDHRAVSYNEYMGEVTVVVSVLSRKDWLKTRRT